MIKKVLSLGILLASILTMVPAMAETSSTTPATRLEKLQAAQQKLQDRYTTASKKIQDRLTAEQNRQASSTAAIACIAPAVTTREAAIGSAFAAFSAAQTTALSTRAAALQAAWALTDLSSHNAAVKAAWSAYRTAHKTAVQTHNTATKAAWSTFRAAVLVCKPAKTVQVETQSGTDNVQ